MGFESFVDKLAEYRLDKQGAIDGNLQPKWFSSFFGSMEDLLSSCDTSDENRVLEGLYKDGKFTKRIQNSMKLDYLCAMRRDIRKQYFSGESDPYTDVTPYRTNVTATRGAIMFDDITKEAVKYDA